MLFLNVHKYRKDIEELYYSPSGPQIFFYLIRNPAFFRLTKSIPSVFLEVYHSNKLYENKSSPLYAVINGGTDVRVKEQL
jgi:hypothetical protein